MKNMTGKIDCDQLLRDQKQIADQLIQKLTYASHTFDRSLNMFQEVLMAYKGKGKKRGR